MFYICYWLYYDGPLRPWPSDLGRRLSCEYIYGKDADIPPKDGLWILEIRISYHHICIVLDDLDISAFVLISGF